MRNLSRNEWAAVVFAMACLLLGGIMLAKIENDRQLDNARSSLSLCFQIEVIKAEIRTTVSASLERLPQVDYYKKHPDELAQAEEDAIKSVRLFKALDCYSLPAVKDAGLRREEGPD